MNIVIIGAGAMGCVYAGLLAEAGHKIDVVDVWREHVDTINASGLKLTGASGDRVVTGISAHTETDGLDNADLVVIATKASSVGDAARAAQKISHENSLILTIQNGLGAGERIQQFIDGSNILLGVAGGFGASIEAPGHAHHNGMQLIRIGELNGGFSARVQSVADVWQRAGFNVKAYDDINQLIWEKFVCNVAFSGSCTVLNLTLGEVMSTPEAWKIALECACEAYRAGRAEGVRFDFDDVSRYVLEFGGRMPDARPSMLQDHMAGRRSEIDAINGMVPVVSARHGLDAPYNAVISAVVRARERAF
ncbi:MAG: 2-dehydropantoate 2-reductase [Pseudomonadota bacterium]